MNGQGLNPPTGGGDLPDGGGNSNEVDGITFVDLPVTNPITSDPSSLDRRHFLVPPLPAQVETI